MKKMSASLVHGIRCIRCLKNTHISPCATRLFQTTPLQFNAVNSNVKSKMMTKLIEKRSTTRKKGWSVPGSAVTEDSVPVLERKRKLRLSTPLERRAEQVRTVLESNIVQLLQSGELHPDLTVQEVEVTKVRMVADFSSINVYWVANGDEDAVEELLHRNAGALRTALQDSNLIGSVPKVTFVRDKGQMNSKEVFQLLENADFGPDPSEADPLAYVSNIKKQLGRKKPEEGGVKDDLEVSRSDVTDIEEAPQFRQDLYGLQHDEIMQKLNEVNTKKQSPEEDLQDVTTSAGSQSVPGVTRAEAVKAYANLLQKTKKKKKQVREVEEYTLDDYWRDVANQDALGVDQAAERLEEVLELDEQQAELDLMELEKDLKMK